MTPQETGCRTQNSFVVAQFRCHKCAVGQPTDPNGAVHPLFDQRNKPVHGKKIDGQIRILASKSANQRQDKTRQDPGRQRNAQMTAQSCLSTTDFQFRGLQIIEQNFNSFQKHTPFLGRPKVTTVSMKQRHTQAVFEFRNSMTGRCCRNSEAGGGRSDAAILRDSYKCLEIRYAVHLIFSNAAFSFWRIITTK